MPLELLRPNGLWMLGLLAPLVVLYILKVRRKRRRIASTWLWSQAQRDLMAKSPFRKLVVQVPLILQFLALALLALALARPATRGGTLVGDHVAIIVDTSASMSTLEPDGRTRLQAGIEVAKKAVQALGPGADAMIIDGGREARIASPLDRDHRRLNKALEQLQTRDVEGNLARAVSIAVDRLRQLSGERRIVLITDGALAKDPGLKGVSVPVDLLRVGTAQENTAVIRLDIRSGRDSATRREQVQAFAMVRHHGKKPRDIFVTLRQHNVKEPLASRKLRLAPGERTPVVLTFEATPGDRGSGLILELNPPDAMTVDDRAYGRVPVGRELPVVLAPKSANPWVKRALLADPDVSLSAAALPALATAGVPPDALVVVDGACPKDLPGGASLILNPPAGACRNAVVGKLLDAPEITSWTDSDPRLRFLTLDGVRITKARSIETESPGEALINTREGVVASDISLPGRKGTLVSFDVGESNWPLKASFVLFVRNVVELARANRARGITGPARTGEPLRVRVPSGAQQVKVVAPGAEPKEELARRGLAVVPDAPRAGFYHVSWQGSHPGSVLVPANLTSPAESDSAPREVQATAGPIRQTAASSLTEAHTEWGWLLAAVALLLIALDAWWLTRKPLVRKTTAPARPKLPERARSAS